MPLKPGPLGSRDVRKGKLSKTEIVANKSVVDRAKSRLAGRRKDIGAKAASAPVPAQSILVLYDSAGPYGYVGDLYSRQLQNLLTHFNRPVTLLPVEQYEAGMLNEYAQSFYLGVLYDNPLPSAFKSDVITTTHPICWCGYNLWQIAWTPDWSGYNTDFINAFGFEFQYIDGTPYTKVLYKGEALDHDRWFAGQGKVAIDIPSKASALAVSQDDAGHAAPYIVHGGNLWYVADNPMADASVWQRSDRSLAFEDVLHEIVGDSASVDHRALIRIEDVHAESDPTMLRNIADVLAEEGVPFAVCVIPRYRDPLGFWNLGIAKEESINDKPDLIAALHYMESKGGEIIMHGYTHQYSEVSNPGSGVSGDDFEFFRMVNVNGTVLPYGPVWEDSEAWVQGRLQQGLDVLATAGFSPKGWNTPHYLASPVDYQAFQSRFNFSMCRGKTFTIDDQGYLYWLEQETPYPVVDDLGMLRLPETLGYVSTPELGVEDSLPADLVARAHKLRVVRDGWASCFFHWFLPPAMLRELVQGLKSEGYRFLSPANASKTMATTPGG